MTIRTFRAPMPEPAPESGNTTTVKYREHKPKSSSAPRSGWNPEQFNACGIIIRTPSNKILVSQRATTQSSPGMWQIPGGKSQSTETWEQAAIRETLEETGLTIAPGSLDLLGDWTVQADARYHAVVFLVDWPTEDVPAKDLESDKASPWQLMAIDDLRAQPAGMIEGLRLALRELVVPEPKPLPPPEPPPLNNEKETDEIDPIESLVDSLKRTADAERSAADSRRREQRITMLALLFMLLLVATALGMVAAVLLMNAPKGNTTAPVEAPAQSTSHQ